MEYYRLSDKAAAIAFIKAVNIGEGYNVTEQNVTTGYTQPIELADGFYIQKDEVTVKYATDEDVVNLGGFPTAPTSTGYGIVIPSKYVNAGLFPDNIFTLGTYEIPLSEYNGGLAVDLAYLGWQDFRDEQDKPYNKDIKNKFSGLWYELLTAYQNNEIVQL